MHVILFLFATLLGQAGGLPVPPAPTKTVVSSVAENPEPWETVVRLRVPHPNGHPQGWKYSRGTGTVVYSTEQESLVLTCAHLFTPKDTKLTVEQFSGKLVASRGSDPNHLPGVTKIGESSGSLVGLDNDLDVAVVRFNPGKRIAASKVADDAHSTILPGQHARTMGCYQGEDPTLCVTSVSGVDVSMCYYGTSVLNIRWCGLQCVIGMASGRSGSGLFDDCGYLIGVLNGCAADSKTTFYAGLKSIRELFAKLKLEHAIRPKELNPTSFTEDYPVRILDFHATWCPPCKTMRPKIAALRKAGFPIETVDIDQDPTTAAKYSVKAVPTVVIVDRGGAELKRFLGDQDPADISDEFNRQLKKEKPSRPASSPESPRPPPESSGENPKPWETVVRIRVIGNRTTGFGSGTVIASTESEAIVATCAHIFKLDGRPQVAPSAFPKKIAVDCFDGILTGTSPAKVKFQETFSATAIDYDFKTDVGLIRVKTNRRLPHSQVVPKTWEPKAKMKVYAVGCPEGRDATVWATVIRNPRAKGILVGDPAYEAIECDVAPLEGRSGGGLYTTNGYLTGICNFAEPQGKHGLYATQHSIYAILDRNNLQACYAPISEPRALTPEQSTEIARVDADRPIETSSDLEARCLQIFRRMGGKQGPQGPAGADGQPGATGPQGLAGKDGRPGRDGRDGTDGKPGKDGRDGVDATGAPVDLTAILKRLDALEAENKLPTKLMVKVPGGKTASHFFFPPGVDKAASPRDGNGEYLFRNAIGIDMSDFSVPRKAPSTK